MKNTVVEEKVKSKKARKSPKSEVSWVEEVNIKGEVNLPHEDFVCGTTEGKFRNNMVSQIKRSVFQTDILQVYKKLRNLTKTTFNKID